MQLQGLILCGWVAVGRQNWIFSKFYNIFDLHRSPVGRQPLKIWTLYSRGLPYVPSSIHPVNMKACIAQLIHSSLSKLGTIPLKSGNLRVKMSYSEWGPSNGQIYKRPIDTRLNHSGSIPIWLGDLPVQLQGLTLCGWVAVGRQNWICSKFYNIFDLHRSPVGSQPLRIWTLYSRGLPYVPSSIHPVNMKAYLKF